MDILTGILIPFIGTTAGSACVFFLRGELKPGVQKAFLGFASGVMVAASVWSLLIPAMEMSDGLGRLAFLPAVTGFLLGMEFLIFIWIRISRKAQKAIGKRALCWFLQ